MTYQNYDVAGHYDARGRKNNNGGTQSQALVTEVDYGMTDTIGVTVSLPFIASKYTGPPVYFVGGVETHPGPLDDGSYHGAFQDVRVEVRRLFWAGPIAVAPFIGASFPTHNYETVGEAVPGPSPPRLSDWRECRQSISIASLARRVRPRTLRIRTAQQIEGFAFTRSNIDVERRLPDHVTRRAPRDLLAADPPSRAIAPGTVRRLGKSRSIHRAELHQCGRGRVGSDRGNDVYALWLGTVQGSNGAHRARTIAAGVTFGMRIALQGWAVRLRQCRRCPVRQETVSVATDTLGIWKVMTTEPRRI